MSREVNDQPHKPMMRQRSVRSRSSRAVTLTEVVVASALLIATLVPALRALTMAQITGVRIEQKTQAVILAQSKLDEIRGRSIHHYERSFSEDTGDLLGPYLCNVSDDNDPDLRLVSVSVGCDEDGDRRLSNSEVDITLTTYIARRK